MKHLTTVNLPVYAICAIENDDYSGLNEEDTRNINKFLSEYPNCTFEYANDYDEFTAIPEFGLSCDTISTKIWRS